MIKIDKAFIKRAFVDLGYKTKKTFDNNLKRLLKDNWVGYDTKSSYYFIRSLNKVIGTSKAKYKVFQSNLKEFRGFLSACVIKSACKAVKFAKKDLAKYSDIALQKSNSEGQLVSNCYLSERFDLSLSKSRRLKLSMVKTGYGTVNRVFNKLDLGVEHVKHLNNFTDRYYFHRKGNVYITLPDRCRVFLSGVL